MIMLPITPLGQLPEWIFYKDCPDCGGHSMPLLEYNTGILYCKICGFSCEEEFIEGTIHDGVIVSKNDQFFVFEEHKDAFDIVNKCHNRVSVHNKNRFTQGGISLLSRIDTRQEMRCIILNGFVVKIWNRRKSIGK